MQTGGQHIDTEVVDSVLNRWAGATAYASRPCANGRWPRAEAMKGRGRLIALPLASLWIAAPSGARPGHCVTTCTYRTSPRIPRLEEVRRYLVFRLLGVASELGGYQYVVSWRRAESSGKRDLRGRRSLGEAVRLRKSAAIVAAGLVLALTGCKGTSSSSSTPSDSVLPSSSAPDTSTSGSTTGTEAPDTVTEPPSTVTEPPSTVTEAPSRPARPTQQNHPGQQNNHLGQQGRSGQQEHSQQQGLQGYSG